MRQVRPTTEGWQQKKDADGRPLLQFASPKRGQAAGAPRRSHSRRARREGQGARSPGFRAKQLEKHYFTHWTHDPADMTDLPAEGREEFVHGMLPPLLTEVRRLETDRGDTIKFLWKLHDGALVESVLMRYPGRITLCVSSQAGCGMNCPFCATGQAGLTRNMSAAEIIEQIVRANRLIAEGGLGGKKRDDHSAERVSNIVFMGMGEPLANYARVMQAVRVMTDKQHGLGMSARGITVSTVGPGSGDHEARERGHPGDVRALAARARRQAARRAHPGQLAVEGRRGARCRPRTTSTRPAVASRSSTRSSRT